MTETLTKENFWNEMTKKYPAAMKYFSTWIDEYKKENNWDNLFNCKGSSHNIPPHAPKFHDLPLAMQVGIFSQFGMEMTEKVGDLSIFTSAKWALEETVKEVSYVLLKRN